VHEARGLRGRPDLFCVRRGGQYPLDQRAGLPERDRALGLVPPRRAAQSCDRARADDRLELALGAAEPGDADHLLDLLAGWASEEADADPERSRKLSLVWGYVAANYRAIENYRIVPLASSGPMEKAVDLVVARRFKTRGMSWFRRGVSALVRLRLLRLNGTWTPYWSERFAAALRPWPSTA